MFKILRYNGGSTSNLMSHLERKHPSDIPKEINDLSNTNTTQSTLEAFTKNRPQGSKPCSNEVQLKKHVSSQANFNLPRSRFKGTT